MATGTSLVLAAPLTETPAANSSESQSLPNNHDDLRRTDFPEDFVFGAGTAAYQVEGAATEDGKGPSVWDEWTLSNPGKVADGSNGNIACGMYHRYKEDISAMKRMGFDAYRFSISWPRILPGGRACRGINRKGIDYYNDLIKTVIDNDMKPCVTLFHWDLPASLEKEYGGFLSKKIVDDFRDYVELCFWEFGDRVKWWTTINEPWTYSNNGYVLGVFPPGETAGNTTYQLQRNVPAYKSNLHTAPKESIKLSSGTVTHPNPAKDAYTVTRNLLLAHATAVHSYRTKFKEIQKGEIGLVLNSHWHWPYHADSEADQEACYRAVDFMLGWFLDPILKGEYPESMQKNVPQDNLAGFSKSEMQLVKNSIDFLGLNYYTTNYAIDDQKAEGEGYPADQKIKYCYFDSFGVPIGHPTGSDWLYVVPEGLYQHLQYLANTYPNLPPLYITENGVSEANDHTLVAKDVCADSQRKMYHQEHLFYLIKAMLDSISDTNKSNDNKSSDTDINRKSSDIDSDCTFKNKLTVKGYFIWAWCDNFEWASGYTARFGINYIDYMNNQTRYPKSSAMWFVKFLKGGPPKIEGSSKKRSNENGDPENGQAEKRARVGED